MMPIKRKARPKTVFLSLVHGFVVGCISIGLFALLLHWSTIRENEKATVQVPNDENVVETNAKMYVTKLYAHQLGVFSSLQTASAVRSPFASSIPPAIFKIGDTFFVWNSLHVHADTLEKTAGSFMKEIIVDSSSCSEKGLRQLAVLLNETNDAKFYFDKADNSVQLPPEWKAVTSSMAIVSKDLAVIKAQLLSHYYSKDSCVKIEF